MIESEPRAPALAVMPVVWKLASPVSGSEMVRVPESERVGVAASSVTAPEASPPMTAAFVTTLSLTVIVNLVVDRVPSASSMV